MPSDSSSEDSWVQVLEGSTFMLSDPRGDVIAGSIAGLYHDDTRYVNAFALRVGGERPSYLSSGTASYGSAAFFMTNPELDGIPQGTLSIQRYRYVGGGLSEVILVASHHTEPVDIEVRLTVGADFADLFEVKDQSIVKRGRFSTASSAAPTTLTYDYEHQQFSASTRIDSSEPGRVEGNDLVFDVHLEPHATWKTRIRVAVRQGDRMLEPLTEEERAASQALMQWRRSSEVLERWREQAPALEARWDVLELVYRTSIEDLAALRLSAEVEGNDYALPAAGLPWFMAIFGRDTLITSYQSVMIGPELARGALRALGGLQGKEVNDFKDEEPGKILHEIRFGELTVLGDMPHRPYYGTADATPLFLVLLSEYWRCTGDDATVRELRPNALAALEWIDQHGDRDGDGYVEYATRSSRGLRNQGWKDSWNGVLFADGSLAEPPIALCEIQGYVYDAKRRLAELARGVWEDTELAARLESEAETLFDRFNEDFWVEGRGGHYAEALDADKRPVDSVTSNMGHLLWSGIVPEDRARVVATRLMSPSMFTGWGIRTMSSEEGGYNPIAYHNGTVWPHDNSLISAGLARYGFREQANRVALTMLEAAAHTLYRLPEVFAGYPRSESWFPVRYPTASSPQAWATAAPFLWLRVALGIEPRDGRLEIDPDVPAHFGRVTLSGLHALGGRFDVTAEGRSGEVVRSG